MNTVHTGLPEVAAQLRRHAQKVLFDPFALKRPSNYVDIEHGGRFYRLCLSRMRLSAGEEMFILSVSKFADKQAEVGGMPPVEECLEFVEAILPGGVEMEPSPLRASRQYMKIVTPASN